MFCEKGVLKNLAKFTEKHLSESLFLIESGIRPSTLLKRGSNTGNFM